MREGGKIAHGIGLSIHHPTKSATPDHPDRSRKEEDAGEPADQGRHSESGKKSLHKHALPVRYQQIYLIDAQALNGITEG